MKKIIIPILFSAVILGACIEQAKHTETKKEIDAVFNLDQNAFPVTAWKTDNSHHKELKGTLTVNGKAVVGADVQVSDKRILKTDEKGQVTLTIDSNIIEKETIHVVSADEATIEGKKLDKNTKEKLVTLKQPLTVEYPITVAKIEENPNDANLVDVYAVAETQKGEEFPKFSVEKFAIEGTIKDADGKPVEGATVNIRRDGVEGFSMSEPSNPDGKFAMYYIPEDDENHYFFVHIPKENKTYTLPPRKTFLFPGDHGVKVGITLPKEGTIIIDKPPTLTAETAPGALFKGILIGVNTDAEYKITIPKRDGTFKVTLPKEEWEKHPTFYEILYRGYHLEEMVGGSVFTSDMLPRPESNEPDNVVAK